MQTKTGLALRSSKLVEDYMQWQGGMPRFFNYAYRKSESFAQRLKAIAQRSYKRSQLSEVLTRFNQNYTDNKKVFENIKKLETGEGVAVVGGQQAGLLTGAALTVHKCLTIIKFAEEQERQLRKPVVPVFWIAGEDHDFDEINHLFVHENGHFKKCKYDGPLANKQSISDLKLKHDELLKWVRRVFAAFDETAYTKDVLAEVETFAEKSASPVDFFFLSCYIGCFPVTD
ncbi:bacillithiol biosynthesis BshC [Terrilactibacillus sp. S3-3]|nr:bacillithiol biosynthesis BshC [Terrilactibacillus sp. S3-3]